MMSETLTVEEFRKESESIFRDLIRDSIAGNVQWPNIETRVRSAFLRFLPTHISSSQRSEIELPKKTREIAGVLFQGVSLEERVEKEGIVMTINPTQPNTNLSKITMRRKGLASLSKKHILSYISGKYIGDLNAYTFIVKGADTPNIDLDKIYNATSKKEIFKLVAGLEDMLTFRPPVIDDCLKGNFLEYFKEFYRVYYLLHNARTELKRIDVSKIKNLDHLKDIIRRFQVYGIEFFDVDGYRDLQRLKKKFEEERTRLLDSLSELPQCDLQSIYLDEDKGVIERFFESQKGILRKFKEMLSPKERLSLENTENLTVDQLKWLIFRIYESRFEPANVVSYYDAMRDFEVVAKDIFDQLLLDQRMGIYSYRRHNIVMMGDGFMHEHDPIRNLGIKFCLFKDDAEAERFYQVQFAKRRIAEYKVDGTEIVTGKDRKFQYGAVIVRGIKYAFARLGKVGILIHADSNNDKFIDDSMSFFQKYFSSAIFDDPESIDTFKLFESMIHGPLTPWGYRRVHQSGINTEELRELFGLNRIEFITKLYSKDYCTYFKPNGYRSGHCRIGDAEVKFRTPLWNLFAEIREKWGHSFYKESEVEESQKQVNESAGMILRDIISEPTLRERKSREVQEDVARLTELYGKIGKEMWIKEIESDIDSVKRAFQRPTPASLRSIRGFLDDLNDSFNRLKEENKGEDFSNLMEGILSIPSAYFDNIDYWAPEIRDAFDIYHGLRDMFSTHPLFICESKRYEQKFNEARYGLTISLGREYIKSGDPVNRVIGLLMYFVINDASFGLTTENLSDKVLKLKEGYERMIKGSFRFKNAQINTCGRDRKAKERFDSIIVILKSFNSPLDRYRRCYSNRSELLSAPEENRQGIINYSDIKDRLIGYFREESLVDRMMEYLVGRKFVVRSLLEK